MVWTRVGVRNRVCKVFYVLVRRYPGKLEAETTTGNVLHWLNSVLAVLEDSNSYRPTWPAFSHRVCRIQSNSDGAHDVMLIIRQSDVRSDCLKVYCCAFF